MRFYSNVPSQQTQDELTKLGHGDPAVVAEWLRRVVLLLGRKS